MTSKLFILILVFSHQAALAQSKIAIVDIQKIIDESSQGKKAKAILEEEFKIKKKEIEKKETALKKLTDELQKKQSVLSEEAARQKQQELQGEILKFREAVEKDQIAIQKRQSELAAPLLEKISKMVDKIFDKEGFDLVLEKRPGIIRYDAKLDISKLVLAEVEKN